MHAYTTGWLTSPGHLAVPYAYSLSRADPPGLILRSPPVALDGRTLLVLDHEGAVLAGERAYAAESGVF